jgi:RNA polymerase sigma-70 factor, ECF subfamily
VPRLDTLEVDFAAMYRQEVSCVYAFLYRQGAPKSELADLTHDVFTAAINRWSTFDRRRPVRPWLLGIAWREVSGFRARKRPEMMDELPEVEDPSNPDASLEARDAQRLVRRGLLALDETKRAAFVLHALEGLSVQEVSEVMSVPVQTTYSRLRAAREELAVAVRRIARGEP